MGTSSEPGTVLAVEAQRWTKLWLFPRSTQPRARVARPGTHRVWSGDINEGSEPVWGRHRGKTIILYSPLIHCKKKHTLPELWHVALIGGFKAKTIGQGVDYREMEKPGSLSKGGATPRMEKYTHVAGFPICQEKPEIWILCEISWFLIFGNECKKNLKTPCGPKQCRPK